MHERCIFEVIFIEVSKIDMPLNKKCTGILAKYVYPGVVYLIRLFFLLQLFYYIEHFCRQLPFYLYSWPHTFNSSHSLILSFSHPFFNFVSSSHLQIFSSSHPHTFWCGNTHMLKLSIVRNSQIFSPAVLQKKISSCKLLARSTWDLLSFTPCPVLLHAKKTHPQEQHFPVLLLGRNTTTGAENPVPIDLRRAVSREKEKRVPVLL